jgi:hypothetical protein
MSISYIAVLSSDATYTKHHSPVDDISALCPGDPGSNLDMEAGYSEGFRTWSVPLCMLYCYLGHNNLLGHPVQIIIHESLHITNATEQSP